MTFKILSWTYSFYMTLGKSFNPQVPPLQEENGSWPKMQFQNKSPVLIVHPCSRLDLIIAMRRAAPQGLCDWLTSVPVALRGLLPAEPTQKVHPPSCKGPLLEQGPTLLVHLSTVQAQAWAPLATRLHPSLWLATHRTEYLRVPS